MSFDSTGKNDYYSRVHAEQYAFHGDPALVINASTLPDYVVEKAQMSVNPNFVSVSDTSFSVQIKVFNIGRATGDPVSLRVTRETPGGEIFTLATKNFASINLVDSISVEVPIISDRDKGINKISATVDYTASHIEVSETNNEAIIEVMVSEDEIRPVFPYNLAIVTHSSQKLFASTVNPLNTYRKYILELDTTALYNSAAKVVSVVSSTGGIIEFDPQTTFVNGTTYYWRVAPDSTVMHWKTASFVYQSNGTEGFQQSHLFQNTKSSFENIAIDSVSGLLTFTPRLHNLFITNSIYPTSGTEDEHFSISVDGTSSIRSACVGRSIVFNVFDPITFKPWLNTTRPFGAAAACSAGREYNFEYSYTTAATRKNAMDFLDAVPKGYYVVARLILDDPYNTTAKIWAADTLVYGKNTSLYSRLKASGFAAINSFSFPRTWAFVYKKGDTTFAPSYGFSQGMYDRVNLSINCQTTNTSGTVTSPKFGPARIWKTINWNGSALENGNDRNTIKVIATDKNNRDTLFATIDEGQHSFDISGLSATQYPHLRLQLESTDSISVTPFQLQQWNVWYTPVPEGALAPNLYYNIPDTLGTYNSVGSISPDTLHISIAYKNVSKAGFDSIPLKVLLYNADYIATEYPVAKLRPLPAGDSLHIELDLDVSGLSGWYNLFLQVNPDSSFSEQHSFNNFLYKYVYFDKGSTLPVNTLTFTAVAQNNTVHTSWSLMNEANIQLYELQRLYNGAFKTISTVSVGATKTHFADDNNAATGNNYYRLKMMHTDGSVSYSPVRMVALHADAHLTFYPNPVKDVLRITSGTSQLVEVKLLNVQGQQVRQLKFAGTTTLYMGELAAGTYLLQFSENGKVVTKKIQKQ